MYILINCIFTFQIGLVNHWNINDIINSTFSHSILVLKVNRLANINSFFIHKSHLFFKLLINMNFNKDSCITQPFPPCCVAICLFWSSKFTHNFAQANYTLVFNMKTRELYPHFNNLCFLHYKKNRMPPHLKLKLPTHTCVVDIRRRT